MDLFAVMAEIAVACRTLPNMSGRVAEWDVGSVTGNSMLVTLPEEIEFDLTYGRGLDKFSDMIVMLLLPRGNVRAAYKTMGPYVKGDGASSVKKALEAYTYTTCDRAVVTRCGFDEVADRAGVSYLAAVFHLDVYGNGG
jgi:hypothetical protein